MKEKEPLVSVIIPVYNVEKYLRRCLDSVINQTYKNLEIVVVDDGSTDGSGEICDEYAKKDKRIKVIHKENGGLSDARNVGIRKSIGDYVTFIDSDDAVLHSHIETFISMIKKYNVEIAVSGIETITSRSFDDNTISSGNVARKMDTMEALKLLLSDEHFSVSANNKIYRRNLFENFKYPSGKLYEDNGSTYKLIMECDELAYNSNITYLYHVRKDSITSNEFDQKKLDYIVLTDKACSEIIRRYPNLKEECMNRRLVARFSVLRQMLDSNLDEKHKKERDRIIREIKRYSWVALKSKKVSLRNKCSILALLLSRHLLRWVGNIYEKVK